MPEGGKLWLPLPAGSTPCRSTGRSALASCCPASGRALWKQEGRRMIKVTDIIDLACVLPCSMAGIVLLHAEVPTYVCRQYPVYTDHTLPGSASRNVRVTEKDASLHAAALPSAGLTNLLCNRF